jgi:hypothetical protein
VIKKDNIGRAHSIHVEIRKAYTVLVGKHEGKGPLRRPTHRWKANTGCNRIRYTNLKMYCDQTLISQHSLLQSVCQHFKCCAHGHHRLVCCSRPSKWRTLLTWKRRRGCELQFQQNHSATLVQWWCCTNYGKAAPTKNPLTSGKN